MAVRLSKPSPLLFKERHTNKAVDMIRNADATDEFTARIVAIGDPTADRNAIMTAIQALKEKRGNRNIFIKLELRGYFKIVESIILPSYTIVCGGSPSLTTIMKLAYSDTNQYTCLLTNTKHDASGYDGDENIIIRNLTLTTSQDLPRSNIVFICHSKRCYVYNCKIDITSQIYTHGHCVEFNSSRVVSAYLNTLSYAKINSNTLESLQYDASLTGTQSNVLGLTFNADGTKTTDVFYAKNKHIQANVAVGSHQNMTDSRVYVYADKANEVNVYGYRQNRCDMFIHSCSASGASTVNYSGNHYGIAGVSSSSPTTQEGGLLAITNTTIKNFTAKASTENNHAIGVFSTILQCAGVRTNNISNNHINTASSVQYYNALDVVLSKIDETTPTFDASLINIQNDSYISKVMHNILRHSNGSFTGYLFNRRNNALNCHAGNLYSLPNTVSPPQAMLHISTAIHSELNRVVGSSTSSALFIDFRSMIGTGSSQSISTPMTGTFGITQVLGAKSALSACDVFKASGGVYSNTVTNSTAYRVKYRLRG